MRQHAKKRWKKMGVLTHNQPAAVPQYREKSTLIDRVAMLNDTDTISDSLSLKALHEINSRQEELPIALQEWTFHPIEDLRKEVAHIDSLYSWLIQGNHPQKDMVDPLFNRLNLVEKEAQRLKDAGSLQPQQLTEITSFIQKVDQTLKASETWLGMKKDYLECEARLEQELSELTDHMEDSLDGMHPDALDHLKGGLSYLQQLLHFSKLISLTNSDSSFDQTFKQNIPKEYELSLRAFCFASEDYIYQILDYLDSPKGIREKELPQLTSFIDKAETILPKLETDISNSQIPELSNLKKALFTLNSRLAELHTVPVVYDETEKENFFSRCSKYLAPLNPENWSDTTKRCVFAGLVAMQLSAEGIKVHENIKYGKPLPPTPSLLSDEQQDMLDREIAYMGTLLRDKYTSLQKKRAFEALTKRAPETREGLQKMLEQLGPNQPTSAQIQEALESYRLARTQAFLFSHPQGREVQPLEGESSSETSYIQSIWNYFFGAQEEVRESAPEPSAPVEDEIVSFISSYDSQESPSQVDQLSKILEQLSETSLASEHVLAEVSQQEEKQKMIMARVDSIFSGTAGELARIRAEIEMLKTMLGSSEHTKKLLTKHAALVEQMEAVQEKWELTTLDQEDVRSLFIDIDRLGKALELFRLSYSQNAQDTRNAQVLETFLASSTPYSITNQMLLHILGDSYGSETKLEGGYSESFIEFLIDVIHKRMDSLASHQLCSEDAQVDFCQDFIGELSFDPIHQETFSELKQHLEIAHELGNALKGPSFTNYYQKFGDHLDRLEGVGSAFFYPIRSPGHALAFEVIKEDQGLFTIRVYNTGEGSEGRHPTVVVESEQRSLPFTEYQHVTKDSLTGAAFHSGLYDLAHAQEFEYDAHLIYDHILPALGGTFSVRSYSLEEYLKPQVSGTCSYRSLEAVMSQLLGNTTTPRRFNWEVSLFAINHFYRGHQDTLATDSITRNNLKKALVEVSTMTNQFHEQGMISDTEKMLATSKLRGIGVALDVANDQFEKQQQAKRELSKIIATPPIHPTSHPGSYVPPSMGNLLPEEHLVPKPEGVQKAPTLPAKLSPKTFSNDLSTFISSHTGSLEQVKQNLKNWLSNDFEEAWVEPLENHWMEAFNAIHHLPPPSSTFWDEIPEEEIETTLDLVGSLSLCWFDTLRAFSRSKGLNNHHLMSEEFVAQMKLVTLMDRLGQRLEYSGQKLPNLYLSAFDAIFTQNEKSFNLRDPLWEEELSRLKTYWESRQSDRPPLYDKVDFFGTETVGLIDLWSFMDLYPDKETRKRKNNQYIGTEMQKDIFIKRMTDWPFQDWVETFLSNNPSKKKQLQDAFPKESSLELLALHALADQVTIPGYLGPYSQTDCPKALPAPFYLFRNMAYLTRDLFQNRISTVQSDKNNLFKYELKRSPNVRKEETVRLEITHDTDQFSSSGCNMDYSAVNYCKPSLPGGEILHHLDPPSSEIKEIWERVRSRQRLSPREIFGISLYMHTSAIKKFGQERVREYLMLSSNSATQVRDTLSYFLEHSEQLIESDIQWFFERLVFEAPLLFEAVQKDPQEAEITLRLFGSLLTRLKDLAEIKKADPEFISRIDHQFTQRSMQALKNYPKEVQEHLKSFLPQVAPLIETWKIEDKTKKAGIAQEKILGLLGKETLDTKDLTDLVSAQLHAQYKERNQEDAYALLKYKPELRQALENEESRDLILNEALSSYLPHFSQAKWKPYATFPFFISEEGDNQTPYVIDVLSGKLWTRAGIYGPIPDHYFAKPPLKQIDRSKAIVHPVGPSTWGIKTAEGEEYLAESSDVVYKKIQNQWFKLNLNPNLSIKPLNEETLHWTYTDENKKSYTYIESRQTQQPLAWVEYEDNAVHIHQLDPLTGEKTNAVLEDVNQPDSPLHFLTDIEDPAHILFWKGKETGLPLEVYLPRLGLHFSPKFEHGGYQFESTEYPGYFITKEQGLPALKEASHYLVLEKQKGSKTEKRVLIPKIFYQDIGNDQSSLAPSSNMDPSTFKQGIHVYDVKSKTGKLKPHTLEGRFFLGQLFSWHHHYLEALETLSGYGGQRRLFKPEENDVLYRIFDTTRLNHDHTPERLVVQLKARTLLLMNARDFGAPPDNNPLNNVKFLEDLYNDYSQYLQYLPRWESMTLLPEEESIIASELLHARESRSMFLKVSPQYFDFMKQRKKVLEEGKDTEACLLKTSTFQERPPEKMFRLDAYYIYDAIKSNQDSPDQRGTLLNPHFGNQLPLMYQAMKDQKEEDLLDALKLLTGKDFPNRFYPSNPSLKKTLTQELSYAFHIAKKNKNVQNAALIFSLQKILESPEKFPGSEQFAKDFQIGSNFFSQYFACDTEIGKDDRECESNGFRSTDFIRFSSIIQSSKLLDSLIGKTESTDMIRRLSSEPLATAEKTSESLRLKSTISPEQLFPLPSQAVTAEFAVPKPEKLVTTKDQEPLDQDRLGLIDALSIKTNDLVANRLLENLENSIQAYEGPAKAVDFELTDWKDVYAFGQSMGVLATESKEHLYLLRERIENALNDPQGNDSLSLTQLDDRQRRLTIDDGISLYLRRTGQAALTLNPTLDKPSITHLLQMVHEYLILSTNHQSFERIAKAAHRLSEEKKQGNLSQSSINTFGRAIHSRRHYDIQEHPEYLVLEHTLGFLLWEMQVEALKHFDNPVALELIMGSGKSAVLLPLLSLAHADGQRLAIGVMPTPLLGEMSEGLSESLGEAFRQVVETIRINRDTDLDELGLERLLQRMEYAQKEKKVVLFGDSDIQSLFLRFAEVIYQGGSKDEIALYRKIFQLLKASGSVAADEIDMLMNVLISHHFTIGQSEPLQPSILMGTEAFFQILMTHPQIRETFSGSPIGQASPNSFKKNGIEDILAVECLNPDLYPKKSPIRLFLKKLSSHDKTQVINYVKGSNEPAMLQFIDHISEESVQDTLAVLREQIIELAPLTLSKKHLESYGVADLNELIATPRKKGVPVKGSQFGTDLEIINYTMQAFLKTGIPSRIVAKELDRLKASGVISLSKNPKITLQSLPDYQLLCELLGKSEIHLGDAFTEDDYQVASEHMKKRPDIIVDVISRYILPLIKTYPHQLNANPQVYSILFREVFGMSGTIWNLESLPRLFSKAHLSDTDVKTLFLLWKESPHEVTLLEDGSLSEMVRSALQTTSSLIDSGGNLLAWKNEDIATEMLKTLQAKQSSKKGVAFADENDRWWIKTSENSPPILYSHSDLDREDVAVFWDQSHTTGSDVKTSLTEKATIIVSPQMTLRDVLQSAWRLRQLDQNQSVHFALNKKDEQTIRSVVEKATNKPIEGSLELKHILLYVLYNQASKVGDHNYRSLKHQLEAALLKRVWKLVLNPTINDDILSEALKKVEPLFYSEAEKRPYKAHGQPVKQELSGKVALALLENTLNGPVMEVFRSDPLLKEQIDISSLEEELKGIVEEMLPLLPKKLSSKPTYGLQRAVHTQKETNTNKEKEQEKQKETTKRIEGLGFKYRDPSPSWVETGLFTKAYFSQNSDILPLQNHMTAWKASFTPQFSKDLLITRGLAPIDKDLSPEFQPFAPSQEYPHKILVKQDKDSGHLQCILLEKLDSKALDLLLKKDEKNPQERREVKLALYDLGRGGDYQGRERIDFETLEKDPAFLELVVQAKFFAGKSDYSSDELKVLEKWILENGLEQMRSYFIGTVLNERSDSYEAYVGSSLYKLFEEHED